jgi:adrenodoxin-NADP+ reductase
MYTAKYLLKELAGKRGDRVGITIDIVERLPTPFGLVRSGVAPDHPEVKNVINDFTSVMDNDNVRFFGNVNVGVDLQIEDLRRAGYDGIVLAYGASHDRHMHLYKSDDIKIKFNDQYAPVFGNHPCTESEQMDGVISARSFVNWYNGHPDFSDLQVDLSAVDTVVVIGNGNVAIDVCRILLSEVDKLAKTDIPQYALRVLKNSSIKTVHLIGRRGPVQSSFTTAELRELTTIPGLQLSFNEKQLTNAIDCHISPASAQELESNRPKRRKVDLMMEIISKSKQCHQNDVNACKQLCFEFFLAPLLLEPSYSFPNSTKPAVGKAIFSVTQLSGPCDHQIAMSTSEIRSLPSKLDGQRLLVIKSVGYQSEPLAGVPFDTSKYIVPSVRGRVIDQNKKIVRGLYVSGWLKRGAVGIIGSNIADAKETALSIVEDIESNQNSELFPSNVENQVSHAVDALWTRIKCEKQVQIVTKLGWHKIHEEEVRRGKHMQLPTISKIVSREDLLMYANANQK